MCTPISALTGPVYRRYPAEYSRTEQITDVTAIVVDRPTVHGANTQPLKEKGKGKTLLRREKCSVTPWLLDNPRGSACRYSVSFSAFLTFSESAGLPLLRVTTDVSGRARK